MPPPARGRLSPWIQSLILNYGEPQDADGGSGGRLKAHVIGVGRIPASQAQTAEGPTGVLFLSDSAVQIPAVLTAAAWERLQEQEDRESFGSLLNATVCVRDSRLLFHADPEQTRCRFYLSVGELATTAAGPARDSTPCCTSLPAVRQKICRTWRALRGDDSQRSQRSQDLSELLGAWRHDCLQDVLDGVRQHLAASQHADGARPSGSRAPLPPPSSCRLTGWDLERTRDKAEAGFNVPVGHLLLPEDAEAGGVLPSGDEAAWRIPEPPATASETGRRSARPAEAAAQRDSPVAGLIGGSASNPWDMFPPPCVTHSSPDTTPPPLTDATASKPDRSAAPHSFLPPYQELLAAASDGQQGAPETLGGNRKQREDSAEALAALQEGEGEGEAASGSPPSWLFNSQAAASGSTPTDDGSPSQTSAANPAGVHGDGTPFTYSYPPTGRNLQDLSGLGVAGPLLQWAVRYLLAAAADGTAERQDAV